MAHRRELIDQCSDKLRQFDVNHGVIMAGRSANIGARTQVASIQTFTIRKENKFFNKPNADVIILDEAHRSVSKSFKDLIEEYPEAYVIGLTATPVRNDGKGLGGIYDDLIECGVAHTTPESAMKKLDEIYDDVESWWTSTSVQKAVNDIADEFVKPASCMVDRLLSFVNCVNFESN